MKKFILLTLLVYQAFTVISQTNVSGVNATISKRFTLAGKPVVGISTSPASLLGAVDSLATTQAAFQAIQNRAWLGTGNVVTNNTKFLGTSNFSSLRFITNGVQRMVVDSFGAFSLYTVGPGSGGSSQQMPNVVNMYGLSSGARFLNIDAGFQRSAINLNPNNSGWNGVSSWITAYNDSIKTSTYAAFTLKSNGRFKVDVLAYGANGGDEGKGSVFEVYNAGIARLTVRRNGETNLLVGTDTLNIPSALVAFNSTTRGFLLPRMNTTQMNTLGAIAVPGMLIINTDTPSVFMYNGATWNNLAAIGSGGGGSSDGNNYTSSFTYSATAPGTLSMARAGTTALNLDLSTSLDTRYLQSFTETDPGVGARIKSIRITDTTITNLYLHWVPGYGYTRAVVPYSDISGLGTLATQSGTFSGTTSGTNTGDETNSRVKTLLGITTLSGSNTGDQDTSRFMHMGANLSDLTSAATARTNLGITGTNTGDQDTSHFTHKEANLSDLTNPATARSNLGIGSITGTNTGDQDTTHFAHEESNLSDLTNVATARSNLGLGGGLPTIAGLSPSGTDFFLGTTGSTTTSWGLRSPTQVKTSLAITSSDIAGLTDFYISQARTTVGLPLDTLAKVIAANEIRLKGIRVTSPLTIVTTDTSITLGSSGGGVALSADNTWTGIQTFGGDINTAVDPQTANIGASSVSTTLTSSSNRLRPLDNTGTGVTGVRSRVWLGAGTTQTVLPANYNYAGVVIASGQAQLPATGSNPLTNLLVKRVGVLINAGATVSYNTNAYFESPPVGTTTYGNYSSMTNGSTVIFNTTNPVNNNTTAVFDVQASNRGSLPFPRLDQTAINAITSPPAGLTVYNTTTDAINYRTGGGSWVEVGASTGTQVDIAEQTLGSTVTWTGGTISGGNTNTYQWSQTGKLVTVRININQPLVAGAAISQISFDLPSDMPLPKIPAGYTTSGTANTGDYMYMGEGYLSGAKVFNGDRGRAFLVNNSTRPIITIKQTAAAASTPYALITLQYFVP